MLDDYKKSLVSEEWELSTYSSFEEAHSDLGLEEVKSSEKEREVLLKFTTKTPQNSTNSTNSRTCLGSCTTMECAISTSSKAS
jgi:hypothetical protein